MSVELLRSSMIGDSMIPELHFVCTGLSMLKSYGLKNHEQTFICTLIHREQVH
jgi:hypothetical protein